MTVAGVLIAIPASYFLGGYHITDHYVEEKVSRQTGNLIQNEYTGSIKASVTPSNVTKIKKELTWIYSPTLKHTLTEKTDSVLNQAKLQSDVKEKMDMLYQKQEVNDISQKQVNQLMTQASGILNTDVKTQLLKEGSTVLDRTTRTQAAISAVDPLYENKDHLSDSDLSKYYTADALTKLAYGPKVKQDLKTKLATIKNKINEAILHQDSNTQADLSKKLDSIANATVKFNGGDNQIYVNKLSPAQYSVFNNLKNNNATADLVMSDSNITGYTLSNNGTNVNQALSISVITPFNNKDALTNPQSNPIVVNGNTNYYTRDAIKFGSVYITDGDANNDNVAKVSTNDFNKLVSFINSNKGVSLYGTN